MSRIFYKADIGRNPDPPAPRVGDLLPWLSRGPVHHEPPRSRTRQDKPMSRAEAIAWAKGLRREHNAKTANALINLLVGHDVTI